MVSWSVLIATSFPAAALVANTINSVSLTALRFLVASVLFIPILVRSGDVSLPNLKELLAYIVISITSIFYFWAMFKSLQTTTPLNTGAIFTLVPAITVVAAYFISREKTSSVMFAALVIGCIGSIWVVTKGSISTLVNLDIKSGDSLFLIGCIVLSLYSPLIVRFRRSLNISRSPAYITFWVLMIGTILLTTIALIEQNGNLGWSELRFYDLSVMLYLAIFTTVITFWQLQYCTPILGSVVVMSYTYLIPSFVVLMEIVVFGNSVNSNIYIGVLLTLVSLTMLNKRMPIKDYAENFNQRTEKGKQA
jgi:drug/metabolite transporter (DMT)-like permease